MSDEVLGESTTVSARAAPMGAMARRLDADGSRWQDGPVTEPAKMRPPAARRSGGTATGERRAGGTRSGRRRYLLAVVVAGVWVASVVAGGAAEAGDATYLYDSAGRSEGTVRRRDGGSTSYGPDGRSTGSSREQGETTYFYDPSGRSTGSARSQGDRTYFHGADGRGQGSATMFGDSTYFRDSSGRSTGSARRRGDTIDYYDAAGRRTGSARTP